MARWSNWKGFNSYKEKLFSELKRNHTIRFDRYEETEKAWIIFKGENSYVFPKSKTTLFADNTIQVPDWLYLKNFKEDDKKEF